MEEEKNSSQQEISAQYEEIASLRRKLDDNRISTPEKIKVPVANGAVSPQYVPTTEPKSSWISSMFGYLFSSESNNSVEAFTV